MRHFQLAYLFNRSTDRLPVEDRSSEGSRLAKPAIPVRRSLHDCGMREADRDIADYFAPLRSGEVRAVDVGLGTFPGLEADPRARSHGSEQPSVQHPGTPPNIFRRGSGRP